MDQLNKLLESIETIKVEAEKFYTKTNNAAGTRLRKALQEVKNLASEVRKHVSETKETRKSEKTSA